MSKKKGRKRRTDHAGFVFGHVVSGRRERTLDGGHDGDQWTERRLRSRSRVVRVGG